MHLYLSISRLHQKSFWLYRVQFEVNRTTAGRSVGVSTVDLPRDHVQYSRTRVSSRSGAASTGQATHRPTDRPAAAYCRSTKCVLSLLANPRRASVRADPRVNRRLYTGSLLCQRRTQTPVISAPRMGPRARAFVAPSLEITGSATSDRTANSRPASACGCVARVRLRRRWGIC